MSTPFTQRGATPLPVRSGVAGIAWPALPGVAATQLLAQLYQLDASQWLPRPELEALQFEQLAQLTGFAAEQSDHYSRIFHVAGVRPDERWDWATLRRVPLLSRSALLNSCPRKPSGS